MCVLIRLVLVLFILAITQSWGVPHVSAETYRAYAKRIVAKPPAGVRFRADLEAALSKLASAERRKKGRKGVATSTLLRTAARAQAIDVLRTGRVGHRSKRGDRFEVRFAAFGGERGVRGENVLRSQKRSSSVSGQARRMMESWLGSTGHRRNLMGRDYRFVTTGVVQKGSTIIAVQMFWQNKQKKTEQQGSAFFE